MSGKPVLGPFPPILPPAAADSHARAVSSAPPDFLAHLLCQFHYLSRMHQPLILLAHVPLSSASRLFPFCLAQVVLTFFITPPLHKLRDPASGLRCAGLGSPALVRSHSPPYSKPVLMQLTTASENKQNVCLFYVQGHKPQQSPQLCRATLPRFPTPFSAFAPE